ncbi:MAG: hypothetical protein RLZZ609_1793 [Cyanobacteriota bacterium]|jgi:hypothetical protein
MVHRLERDYKNQYILEIIVSRNGRVGSTLGKVRQS